MRTDIRPPQSASASGSETLDYSGASLARKAGGEWAELKPFVTVTGADERTPVDELSEIAAEIGLLYTATPEGRNRYPRREWIAATAPGLRRVAIHVCGSGARRELHAGKLGDVVAHAQRIQVNGILSVSEVEDLCAQYYSHTLITQHKPDNARLLAVSASNHALLIDASGGRGISPESWEPPQTAKPVGYAGGLGPENIAAELGRIRQVARGFWWIDMEGKLRVDDWFCVARALSVVRWAAGAGVGFDASNEEPRKSLNTQS